jgi:hypothetical protein
MNDMNRAAFSFAPGKSLPFPSKNVKRIHTNWSIRMARGIYSTDIAAQRTGYRGSWGSAPMRRTGLRSREHQAGFHLYSRDRGN